MLKEIDHKLLQDKIELIVSNSIILVSSRHNNKIIEEVINNRSISN